MGKWIEGGYKRETMATVIAWYNGYTLEQAHKQDAVITHQQREARRQRRR